MVDAQQNGAATPAAGAGLSGGGGLAAALDAAATVEAALVTVAGAFRAEVAAGGLDLGDDAARFLRATQCQDAQHLALLRSWGGAPAAERFALPPGLVGDPGLALDLLLTLKGIAVGAAMAIARAQAEAGAPARVEAAFAWGAAEAQALAVARGLAGQQPANDRAFARWRFVEGARALDLLRRTGLLDGGDAAVPYPGPAGTEIDCTDVVGLVPETTDDAPPPEARP